jgi:hypothetical protein
VVAGQLGVNTASSQYFQASGEATQQAKLPEQFESHLLPGAALTGNQVYWADSVDDIRRAPIVDRRPRMRGIWHLYRRGMIRMPIQRIGADGRPFPWVSSYQPNDQGPIRNGGFNDALYQAGYPGFNLGLSFKVPTLDTAPSSGKRSITETPGLISVASRTNILNRAS